MSLGPPLVAGAEASAALAVSDESAGWQDSRRSRWLKLACAAFAGGSKNRSAVRITMMPKMKRSPPPPVVSTSSARWPTDSSRHHSPRPTVSGGQRQRDKLRLVAHPGDGDGDQRTKEAAHSPTARYSAHDA